MFVEQAKNLKSGQGEKDPDGPFVLTDMTHEVFITMMEFIYTNRVTLSSKTVRVIYSIYDIPVHIRTSVYTCFQIIMMSFIFLQIFL